MGKIFKKWTEGLVGMGFEMLVTTGFLAALCLLVKIVLAALGWF